MLSDLTYCDFIVFAPLDVEVDALSSALESSGWSITPKNSPLFPRVLEATCTDVKSAHSVRTCVIVQLQGQGVLRASVDVSRALQDYEPGYVISFGIAGSLDEKDAPIGAVVMAESMIYYEPSKDASGTTRSRTPHSQIDTTLNNLFRQASLPGIERNVGPVASGEKLFADIESNDRNRILGINDKTLCVEMEAAGVAAAAERLRELGVVVVKGMSDYADAAKNTIDDAAKTANRRWAAENAARSLVDLLDRATLRRAARNRPRLEEANPGLEAELRAEELETIFKKHGIKASRQAIWWCLHRSPGPVPLYYHWKQLGPNLHWVDFKILLAIRALPRSIVTPKPIATLENSVTTSEPWFQTVKGILGGVVPATDGEIIRHQDELTQYSANMGSSRFMKEIYAKLSDQQSIGDVQLLLNIMSYMMGQHCHSRFFVFSWTKTEKRWEHLSRIMEFRHAVCSWETLNLGGAEGKRALPGSEVCIDWPGFSSLREWAYSREDKAVVRQFVNHFEPHHGASENTMRDFEHLLASWDDVIREGGA